MWEKQLAAAIKAGEKAKRLILEIYKTDFKVEIKKDGSPVTKADKEADILIRNYLRKEFPDYSFLTEESPDDLTRLNNDYVWIIDPLDGTCNFVEKNNGFTINIALSYKHKVVLGVIIIPTTNEIYYATNHGGAFCFSKGSVKEIHVSRNTRNLRVLLSKSHYNEKVINECLNKYNDRIKSKEFVGAAIKACKIAKGDAELSIGLTDKTSEWDTAACQILIKEAGGVYYEPHGTWLKYNRKDIINHNGYVMANKAKNIIL